MALIDKLTAIGTAIREKTGKSDLITLDAMPDEIRGISGGGGAEVEPIVLTDNQEKGCATKLAHEYIRLFGNTISTNNISKAESMFLDYPYEVISFDINMNNTTVSSARVSACFSGCNNLREVPRINNLIPNRCENLFYNCWMLKEIPEDYFDNWDCSNHILERCQNMFYGCWSLRKLPSLSWISIVAKDSMSNSQSLYYAGFYQCRTLDEIIKLPIPNTNWTSNSFSNSFGECFRLKDLTFETNEDGTSKVVNWKSQTIDLSFSIGYALSSDIDAILDYNSGITADKEVKDDATYQALKNDPDWFATNINYSRYNHDSAVATINSLPDTSAYLASAGGTNTIKFKGASGELTDGGAINTMTEEEIAVAAARGWTVSLV